MRLRFYGLLAAVLWLAAPAAAQPARPVPYPVFLTPQFEAAVEAGTRTGAGLPGDAYWTNYAYYDLDATLSPATRMLRGRAIIRYENRSPDALDQLKVHLRQNLHAPGVVRNRPQQVTGGVEVADVRVAGEPLVELDRLRNAKSGYTIDGTVMTIQLPDPVPAGGEVTLSMDWTFEVPEAGAPRMGQDEEVFYLGYWYPQVAVYDDVYGWRADPYMGNGEFYMGYADYDVALTVPEGWLVAATGALQNPDEVLSEQTQARLGAVRANPAIIHVVTEEDRGAGTATAASPTGRLTWRFTAENVRDFAFGASDRYVWDATTADVGDPDGDGAPDQALIHALYRPDTASWERAAEFGQYSIEYLSDRFMPYPWPHMTVVEGIIGGGMEYPMITLIGGARSDPSLFSVTFHEISHMWFPMMVGQDEKSFTWMDEGLTSFNTNEAVQAFFGGNAWDPARQGYYYLAGSGFEVEPMRHGDRYPYGTPARGLASYSKPAVALHALRGIVGAERFEDAYRTYAERWAYKHPYPWDLFNTFEDVLGEDLDWFWRTMFYETWTLDHAVAAVEEEADAVVVTVDDQGLSPMPALVRVTYADGSTADERVPVDVWLGGARQATLRFAPGDVSRVELDPDQVLPDVDRQDNVWTR